MLSDGVDTASDKATRAETRELAKESRAPAYCIYFNTRPEMQGDPRRTIPGATNPPAGGRPPMTLPVPGVGSSTEDYMGGRQYLSDLADYSGGKVFEALRMEDLTPAYDAIARELSSQYSIGYYPTNLRHDGKYRRIDVKVSRPGLYVQTRAGYYAPDDTRKQKK
jgi:VWFA-related protein